MKLRKLFAVLLAALLVLSSAAALADVKIGVPNDTTNEARALRLLEYNGILELNADAGQTATKADVLTEGIEIVEVEAAMLPNLLPDLDYAVMNLNFVLDAVNAGIEIGDPLLLEDEANWERFITLLKEAGKACREVCPKAQIIIHSERTPKPDVLADFFDRMTAASLDYDIIGLSYYPYFHGNIATLEKALQKLEDKNYGKKIQVVETGYPSKWEVNGTTYDYTKTYPYSHEGQRKYIADLITTLQKHPQVNGLSWWYAEANAKGCTGSLAEGWYNASLFDNETGRALPALYELKAFDDGSTGIVSISANSAQTDDAWYSLSGRKLQGKPQQKGIYIKKGEKLIVR